MRPILPLSLLAAGAMAGLAHAAPPPPAAPVAPPIAPAPIHPVRGGLTLRRGSGTLLHLPVAAANVFVADPKVVQVHPAGPTTLFVFGVGAGQTTIAALTAGGGLIGTYGVTVTPSQYAASGVSAQIARMVPGAHVRVVAEPKGLMLTGWTGTPGEAAQAVAIAQGFLDQGQSVENQITVRAATQVLLQVRVVQMTRSISDNLGINWSALGGVGRIGLAGVGAGSSGGSVSALSPALESAAAAATLAPALVPALAGAAASLNGFNLSAAVSALAQDNLVRILAEPNLTVISGKTANFLVGGEVPVPVPGQNGQVTIEFKKFGVSLSFNPVVYSSRQISIEVHPEVSQPDYQNAVAISAANQTLQVPSFSETSAETSVVLGSGQSFAIGGLLQDTINDDGSGVPGIGTIPILGALFHGDNFQRQQTELVIIVTPYIVRPVNSIHQLQTPDENYTPPTDVQRLLFMRQVGTPRHWQRVNVPGHAGFMVQ